MHSGEVEDTAGRTQALREMLAFACWPIALESRGVGLHGLWASLAGSLEALDSDQPDKQLDDWIAKRGRPSCWSSFDRFRAQTEAERQLFIDLLLPAHDVVWSNRAEVLELLVDCVARTRRRPGLKMELRSAVHRITAHTQERAELERRARVAPSHDEATRLWVAAEEVTSHLRTLEPDFIALISPDQSSTVRFTRPSDS